jgi:SMI1 / KNR4 family (SUKH-1)
MLFISPTFMSSDSAVMPFPITATEIAKTEAKTGFTFPLGLKSRFSKDNGGEIEVGGDCWQLIPFLDTSDRKRLARTCNDIVRETTRMRDWERFPVDAFVVAQNGAGDYIIILPDAEGSKELGETLYFWDHETREFESVADSLDTL